jgi:hypothetical protein
MPNFKPKTKKKIGIKSKSSITLDSKHNEKINEFKKIEEIELPKLLNQKKKLKKNIEKEKDIEKKLDLKDKLVEIKKKIRKLKKLKNNYYLQNSKHIFDYFEKKKNLSEGNNKTKVLHNFFKKKSEKINEKIQDMDSTRTVNTYLTNLDVKFLDISNYTLNNEICSCGGEFINIENEGVSVCNKCSVQKKILIESEKPSYKEPPKEVCFYAYKRINHFREILAQFQAKETTQIPEQVIIDIKNQIRKERIHIKQLTNKKAKDILKKLGYNKYYEHIPFIKDKLGIKPPIMSQELEEKLCNLFMDIQKPYAKHCPDDRVNFLNYYYVLYKMCELLNEEVFLPFFPMLKDPVKRIEQDEIWKKICKELHWEFIPTL